MFFKVRVKSGRSGRFGDVIRHSLKYSCISPPTHPHNELGHCFGHVVKCMGEWAKVHSCIQVHHQINQAFPIFLVYVEKHGKAWAWGGRGRGSCGWCVQGGVTMVWPPPLVGENSLLLIWCQIWIQHCLVRPVSAVGYRDGHNLGMLRWCYVSHDTNMANHNIPWKCWVSCVD